MSEEQQVRLNVHTEKMGTSYANAFQVRYSQDDVLVSFGVSLTDLSAEPGVKGDTATNVTKPATLETGAIIKVPLFINVGDKITIDTRTGEYLSRCK